MLHGRKRFCLYLVALLSLLLVVKGKKNVLFLVADDLRPELGSWLGPDFPAPVHPTIHTPHLDALAKRSLVLKKAYCQQSVCSPSRTSLLTGRRPDTTHVYDLIHYFRKVGGNYTTIPQFFKEHGYNSIGMGKIFHPGRDASDNDDPPSWTNYSAYYHSPNRAIWEETEYSWMAVPKQAREKNPLPDEQIAMKAIETLKQIAPKARSGEEPFFLAVGFHKPHLPFVFPEEFLQMYPAEDIHLPDNPYAPVGMPPIAWSDYGELRIRYGDIRNLNASGAINTTLPDEVTLALRRAYYSAVSYMDGLVGDVIKALDMLGLSENTIVSFWGDHGWQLGEHGEWSKHTNFELATHAPMMIHVPTLTNKGIISEKLTEFVDLFPTLVDSAGLPPLPLCPTGHESTKIRTCREGTSMMPLILDINTSWKDRVFSQYPRYDNEQVMGYSMRTERYRYTEWVGFTRPQYEPVWDHHHGTELYDHQVDSSENVNQAGEPMYREVQSQLSKLLRAGWREAMVTSYNTF